MNYWPSLVTNLADLTSPLFNLINAQRATGAETARLMYNKTGAVGHHNTDMWGDTAPQDNYASATFWPHGLTWQAAWIYEQYRFTGNETFLKQNYETMTDLLEFYFGFLTEYNGWKVTNPSLSPENEYFLPDTEIWEALSLGPTIDNSLIWELCGNVIDASQKLGLNNDAYVKQVKELREQLPPLMINYFGGIQEWIQDYKEVSSNSRLYSTSNLFSCDLTRLNRLSQECGIFHLCMECTLVPRSLQQMPPRLMGPKKPS